MYDITYTRYNRYMVIVYNAIGLNAISSGIEMTRTFHYFLDHSPLTPDVMLLCD